MHDLSRTGISSSNAPMLNRTATALALASAALLGCRDDLTSPTSASPHVLADAAPMPAPSDVIPGQYVVLYRSERVALAALTAGGLTAGAPSGTDLASASAQLTTRKLAGGRGVLRQTFGHAVHGFAAALSDSAAAVLRADPDVALVEPDHVMHADAPGVENGGPWGLDRIDQAQLPLDGMYRYGNDGTGTSVYIVDSGINFAHVEFGGRAVTGRDFVTRGGTAADCHGHGTHVAGTVGGATYGVAKNVQLIAARVLDCSGSGSESGVIAALDWVVDQKDETPATPMVVNMSLGGGPAVGLDSAVERTVAAGVTVVVAAGNSTTDACTVSPARAPSAITVGATDVFDRFAGFSNFGSCVDISAPGVRITSAYIGSTTATATMSGTSMATPHVAGSAALYLTAHPRATPAEVLAALTANASTGPIAGLPTNTPARLLNIAFLGGVSVPIPGPILSALGANLCADVQGQSQRPGTPVTIWNCWGGVNQQFVLQSTGEITVYGGTLCLDASPGTLKDGDAVIVWPCWGGREPEVDAYRSRRTRDAQWQVSRRVGAEPRPRHPSRHLDLLGRPEPAVGHAGRELSRPPGGAARPRVAPAAAAG